MISFVVALTLSSGFVIATRKRGRRRGFLWLFLLIFFATWAGGVWLQPVGPTIGGVRWIQFLVSGLIILALIALFTPSRPPHGRRETLEKLAQLRNIKVVEQATYVVLGIMFWVVLSGLIIAIVIRYLPVSAG
ncbi:MAG: hypothetical protein P8X96_19355 [Desulfobacteraceae bacterium]